MHRLAFALWATVGLVCLSIAVSGCGCGSKLCEPGTFRSCTCDNDDDGLKECSGDGSRWGTCYCWDIQDDDDVADDDDDNDVADDDDDDDDDVAGDCEIEVPTDVPSIQAAIDVSSGGDTICVSAGTYTETIDFSGKDVSVIGVDGPQATIIDAAGNGSTVSIMQGETHTAVLAGFTITGGVADSGGGIRVHDASPTLQDLVVEGNEATISGGGIRLSSTTITNQATVVDVTITQNTATSHGGGVSIWAYDGGSVAPQLTDVVVSGNTAEFGGGIAIDTYTLYDVSVALPALLRVSVEQNVATASGGGLELSCGSNGSIAADLTKLRLVDNLAGGDGGGLCATCQGGNLEVTADEIVVTGNEADGDGGGLNFYLEDSLGRVALSHLRSAGNRATDGGGLNVFNTLGDMALEMNHVIFAGNEASDDGGGVLLFNIPHLLLGGELVASLDAVVLAGNMADDEGGALATRNMGNGGVDLALAHAIVVANTALAGGGYSIGAGLPDMTFTDTYGNTPDDFSDIPDPTGTNGNISVDPEFLDLTAVDPLDWDLHLSLTSPLIDAGDPSILDPDGSITDIGAYGGPGAATWDLDWDGYFEWWLPGPYDPATSPGMDCDDGDVGVYPGNGC